MQLLIFEWGFLPQMFWRVGIVYHGWWHASYREESRGLDHFKICTDLKIKFRP